MMLTEAKALLSSHEISFAQVEYENEKEYLLHALMFPCTAKARSCKVIVLVIRSNNGHKDIEVQFNCTGADPIFEELWFGGFCYEMFDYNENMLEADLINNILEIMQGKISVIELNNMKKKRWCADACFDRTSDDDVSGELDFLQAVSHIEKKKSFISKIIGSVMQYEIFDWNNYRCIIK